MKRGSIPAIALLLLVSLPSNLAAKPHHHSGSPTSLPWMLAFDHMYGVEGPFVGEAHPIRGVVATGSPGL
jgi:hypothetical protein